MRSESRFPAWAWWIIGLITVLAISILVLSVVLGIRAGQQQIEIQRRQQLGIALQQAIDFQADGDFQSALEQYQRALVLDPSNDTAQQGIKNLFALVQAGTPVLSRQPEVAVEVAATSTPIAETISPVQTPVQIIASGASTPTALAPATSTDLDDLWETVQSAVKAGRWQAALDSLNLVQQRDPLFRSQEIKEELFTVYINLAGEKDNEDNLEEALRLYDKALALRPSDTEIQQERELIAYYLDVLTYTDVDWTRTIEALDVIYAIDDQYRDVARRLQEAHAALGDQLAVDEQWCDAVDEYTIALASANTVDLRAKRDDAKTRCDVTGSVAANTGQATSIARGTPEPTPTSGIASPTGSSTSDGPTGGAILYSAGDSVTGRSQIMRLEVGAEKPAQVVLQDAAQPSLRSDGQRLAFRNLRDNMAGLGGFDPATGLTLRFTQYVEDSLPSWNAQGSRIVFASNREGDRRWRIYVVWAEENGGTDTLGFGEAPAWHPSSDRIVFRGCDNSGNNCGLWSMSGSGSSQAPLTSEPADTRPAWAPDGSFVAFMSSGRDGNPEVYRVDTASGAVKRLTNSPAIDGLPTVSPDGQWIAFVSNRDGVWKIWAVPSAGGQATVITPIVGDLGNWTDHKLIWVN